MKNIIIKALVNLLMIQTVIAMMCANLALHSPIMLGSGKLMTVAVLYLFSLSLSVIPSVLVSTAFAYFSEKEDSKAA